MEWLEECHIKHLPTGQYLAVTNSPEHHVAKIARIFTHSLDPLCAIGDNKKLQAFNYF